jgi:hypothetical protein
VRPDAAFGLNRDAAPERAVRVFFLKADRATMSLVKRDLGSRHRKGRIAR